MRMVLLWAGTFSLLALVGCSPTGVPEASGSAEPPKTSPWICQQEEDAFGDVDIGCVSLGEIVTGERLALVLTCSAEKGSDGSRAGGMIWASIRGDADFGLSPSRVLDGFADIAFDDGEPDEVEIFRRDDHFTIIDDRWLAAGDWTQSDALMNATEQHEKLTIRVRDVDGVSHSAIIRLDYLEEPLELMEGAGCVRNSSLY